MVLLFPLRTPQHQLLATAHAPEQDCRGSACWGMAGVLPLEGLGDISDTPLFHPQHFKISPSPLKTRAGQVTRNSFGCCRAGYSLQEQEEHPCPWGHRPAGASRGHHHPPLTTSHERTLRAGEPPPLQKGSLAIPPTRTACTLISPSMDPAEGPCPSKALPEEQGQGRGDTARILFPCQCLERQSLPKQQIVPGGAAQSSGAGSCFLASAKTMLLLCPRSGLT